MGIKIKITRLWWKAAGLLFLLREEERMVRIENNKRKERKVGRHITG